MRVLDIGCGVGDVSLVAARMVGRTGAVLGVDRAPEPLFMARQRAKLGGYDWVRFIEADFNLLETDERFDALTGRFILMYLADPSAAIARLTRILNPGGILAFIEFDIGHARAVPELPLLNRALSWIMETYRRVGIEPNMGSKLFAALRGAGLTPHLTGSCRIESGPDAVAYDYAAETLRSLIPRMEELGIASAEEVAIDTLAARLRKAACDGDHCIYLPFLIGAWARV
jgi:ubiquinone/menaquinone biosynthesis C-methylase UbiE